MDTAMNVNAVEAISEATVSNQFVTFTCGKRAFGVEIMSVREIRGWSPLTELPGQDYGGVGVLDIRGNVIEVYDLAMMLGAESDIARTNRVVLVAALGGIELGLVVDTVSDIIYAQQDAMRRPPSTPGGGSGAVSVMIKSEEALVSILDLAKLFPAYARGDKGFDA